MNGFTKKSIGTLTLGEKIKKLRSDRRISLSDVSRNTNIQIKYLEFLEEGAYEKLPVDVYTKGFLKSYAEFLGIDENILIKLFEKEKEIKKNLKFSRNKEEKKNGFKFLKPLKIQAFIFTPKIIAATFVSILILAGLIYLYKEIGSFASVPRLVVLSPEQNAVIQGGSISVEGITDRDAKLSVNEQPVLIDDEGHFRENLILQPGSNIINIKAVNRFKKEVAEIITVQAVFQETPSIAEEIQNTESEKLKAEDVQIEIKVDMGPVQMSVEADGNLVFNGTVLSGGIQAFTAKEKIIIDSTKASSTFIKFNGKDIGALGEKAVSIKGVTFTKDMKY